MTLFDFPFLLFLIAGFVVAVVLVLWARPKTPNDEAYERLKKDQEKRYQDTVSRATEGEEGELVSFYRGVDRDVNPPAYVDELVKRYGFTRQYEMRGDKAMVALIDTRYPELKNRAVYKSAECIVFGSRETVQKNLIAARKAINIRARQQGLERYTKVGRPRRAA